MKRKGWHRKKRRLMPIRNPVAVALRMADRMGLVKMLEEAGAGEHPFVAAMKAHRRAGKPTMLGMRLEKKHG